MRLFRRKPKSVEDESVEEIELPVQEDDQQHTYLEHLDYVLSQVSSLPPFGMSLLEAVGLSSCEDIAAEHGLPLLDAAAISGYAVAASDVEGASEDEPLAMALDHADDELPFGRIREIAAGEVLPVGANAVLRADQVHKTAIGHEVHAEVEPGENVSPSGSDIAVGMQLMQQGQTLDPATVGVLASVGIDRVLVRPRPRVVVISSGDEFVEPGHSLDRDDQVWESTSLMIAAAARAAGAQVFRVPVLTNDAARIRQTISDQLIRADLVITVGGVVSTEPKSAAQVLDGLGTVKISDVAMDPGSRHGVGLLGEDSVPAVLMPGDPSAAYLAFQAFARPVIRKLMGSEPYSRPTVRCIASTVMRGETGRMTFTLGRVASEGGRRMVTPVGSAHHPLLSNLTKANALVLLDEETLAVTAGQAVQCWMLDEE